MLATKSTVVFKESPSSVLQYLQTLDAALLSVQEKEAIYSIAEKVATTDLNGLQTLSSAKGAIRFLINRYRTLDHEVFGVIFMDNQHGICSVDEIFRGTIDGAAIYPREVVKACLAYSACTCIFFHNHPSCINTPSIADKNITNRLQEALALIDVRVLDHIIVAGEEHYSFAEAGLM